MYVSASGSRGAQPCSSHGGVLSQGPPRRGTGVRKAMAGQPSVSDIGQVVMALHGCGIRVGRHL